MLAKAQKNRRGPATAQDTIPYRRMFPDGVCQLDDTHYSKTVQFYDINYRLAQHDDKVAVLNGWGDFNNFFDPTVHIQFSFINLAAGTVESSYVIQPPPHEEWLDSIADECVSLVQDLLDRGSNDQSKAKFITYTIEAESLRAAKMRLEQVEAGILSNLRRLGVKAEPLNGKERLHVLYTALHLNEPDQFAFDWKWLPVSGLSTKDFIAPSGFDFSHSRTFRMGEQYAAVSSMQILASRLDDKLLSDLLSMDHSMIVTMHIQSFDQAEAIKTVKQKMSDLDRSKIDEQMKASRSGYDIDILPSDLNTYGKATRDMLEALQDKDQRMFLLTFLILNTADSKIKLKNVLEQVKGITQRKDCPIISLDFQQEDGLVSSLPLGVNRIEIQRNMTTSALSILVPFTTVELFQKHPEALFYGVNAISHNVIMVDRKYCKNPNGITLGVPGSGKSVVGKLEILFVRIFAPMDDIIICDPEGEYYPLVERLRGQVIRISPNSTDYINPMDLHLNYSEGEDPLSLKSDFLLSLCELVIGGRDGLQPIERTVIDRAVRQVYQPYLRDPRPENLPILGDLYEALMDQPEEQARYIATALEIYVTGSLSLFNHHTNVDINNRVVCFDIKELGSQLKKLGMLIVQDQVWGRVTSNRAAGRYTRYYADEFHLMLREEQTAAYSAEIWKRFRKWGGIPMALTQNVKDLLSSRESQNIFENSDFICMLSQAPGDREILAKQLNISPHQLVHVTNTGPGEGLLFYGNTIVPFINRIPKDTEIYRLITTKPGEINQRKKEENHETD